MPFRGRSPKPFDMTASSKPPGELNSQQRGAGTATVRSLDLEVDLVVGYVVSPLNLTQTLAI